MLKRPVETRAVSQATQAWQRSFNSGITFSYLVKIQRAFVALWLCGFGRESRRCASVGIVSGLGRPGSSEGKDRPERGNPREKFLTPGAAEILQERS